ncbi:hypothetical protein [Streptomyces sp. NRRL S-350]|uniref:hypothetical protein n=1 Tax=Streptomyces sp. NRRL S-350 TaxID=1463902 RepID=UPI0004BEAC7C|nr:hypothetical protein [Streptomyces sp. NRRL S-350]
MTAQAHDYPLGPIDRPRTVGAVRRALPAELRQAFQTALDEADPADLFTLVGQWAAVAQTATDADIDAAAAAVRTGSAPVHELGEVFAALAAW